MVAKLSLLLLAFLAFSAIAQVEQDIGASVAAAYTAASADAPAVITSVEVTEVPITTTADTLTPEEEAAAAAASATAVVSRANDDTSSDTIISSPTTTPESPEQPTTPRRRRNRRAGAGATTGEVHAQAGLLNPPQPSPVTLITCKLDSAGNVADIIMWGADSATACVSGCGGALARDWSAPLSGGRNVGLDFQDAQILQMSQGKLANGTVAYYSFRTDFDVRSCGNVRPNDASVTVTTQGWYANNNAVYTDLATRPTTQLARKFLNSATATCSGGKLSGLTATFNGVLVTYEKYNGRYGRTIGYGLPASCTPFFAGARDFPVDMKACEDWILSQPVAGFPTTTCPTTGNSQQWAVPIPPLEMVTARPANWVYRAVSTAQVNSPKTVQNIVTTAGGPTTTTFYTITIVHAPIRNVTSLMLNWWFNGGFEGTTTLNGVRYPRYLLAHPRDHVTLETVVRGTTAGSAVGSYINNIEFYGAAAGYTLGTDRDFWRDRNYVANNFWRVSALTANSVEYQLTDLPRTVKHTWTETTVSGVPQVIVTTVMELGKAVADGATATEASNQAKRNAAALKMFGGNCVDAAINNWVRHTVEEVGNFQFFLPSLAPKPTGK